jgi:hypothetical protein
MWEIYAYQNADSLFGIFNAAAAIHGSGDYMAAVAAVAFCGFIGQALPGQAQDQGVELLLGQGQRCRATGLGPMKSALVQAPCGAPDAKAVVHDQLDACAAGVGEQVAVVGVGRTKCLHHGGQQPISAAAHVHWRTGQPQGIDADHVSSSRSQLAQSAPADVGQLTLTSSAPRRTLMRMSATAVAGVACDCRVAGNASATNDGGANWAVGLACTTAGTIACSPLAGLHPRPRRHWRTRFAFKPCASATPATDAPG